MAEQSGDPNKQSVNGLSPRRTVLIAVYSGGLALLSAFILICLVVKAIPLEGEKSTPPGPKVGESTPPEPKVGESTPPGPKVGESTPPEPKVGESTPPEPKVGESTPPEPKVGESTPPEPKVGESTPPEPKVGESTPPEPKVGESTPPEPGGKKQLSRSDLHTMLYTVMVAGFLGGMMCNLSGLFTQLVEERKDPDLPPRGKFPSYLELPFYIRPWIGLITGFVVFFIGNLLTIPVGNEPNKYSWQELEGRWPFIAIAILAGFGAQDVVERVKKTVQTLFSTEYEQPKADRGGQTGGGQMRAPQTDPNELT